IGDGGGGTCAGGHIDGAVTLDSNTGGVELGGNTIGGAVKASGNVPTTDTPIENAATQIEGNHIGGTLTCSGNTPAPTNNGKPNTVSSTRTGETCSSPTF